MIILEDILWSRSEPNPNKLNQPATQEGAIDVKVEIFVASRQVFIHGLIFETSVRISSNKSQIEGTLMLMIVNPAQHSLCYLCMRPNSTQEQNNACAVYPSVAQFNFVPINKWSESIIVNLSPLSIRSFSLLSSPLSLSSDCITEEAHWFVHSLIDSNPICFQ